MATFNKFNNFQKNLAEGVHNLSTAQIKVALTNVAPSAANTILSNITEISYVNCSTRNVVTASATLVGAQYRLVLTDLILTAGAGAVGPFRYIVVYDDTSPSKSLIGWADYTVSYSIPAGQTFTIDFSAISIQVS